MNLKTILMFLILLINCSCTKEKVTIPRSDESGILIPSKEVALFIAEPILLSKFGEEVLNEKPFEVYLKSDSIWVIIGKKRTDSNKFILGSSVCIEINKFDARVTRIIKPK